MDAMTLSTTFATIVGLIINFKNERHSNDIQELINWLNDNGQSRYVEIINQNTDLRNQISLLLHQNHQEILNKLTHLNEIMIGIASKIDGLQGFANSFQTNYELSDQAIDVLRQFVNSDCQEIWEMKLSTGQIKNRNYILVGNGGNINYDEHRFIEDDFNSLVDLGLIASELSTKGTQKFKITRRAVKFINLIDGQN